jgi:hypothetical protein
MSASGGVVRTSQALRAHRVITTTTTRSVTTTTTATCDWGHSGGESAGPVATKLRTSLEVRFVPILLQNSDIERPRRHVRAVPLAEEDNRQAAAATEPSGTSSE